MLTDVPAARADTVVAATTTLPAPERYEPRVADVVGVGETGLVYDAEPDATPGSTLGWWHPFGGGPDVALGPLNISATVVGDRVVTTNTSVSPLAVTQRPLPSGTATQVPIPDGYTYVAPTAAGVLLVSFPNGVSTLSLLAWGQTTPTVIPGFPGDADVQWPATEVSDAHGALISAPTASGTPGRWVYVDTDALQVWTLPVADSGGFGYFLGGSTIAWWQGGGSKPVIDTIARPVAGSSSVGPTTTRPAPSAAAAAPTSFTLVPFGDDVLSWQDFHNGGSYGREADAPVYATSSSGTTRTVTTWAHGLRLAPGGTSLYAVTGRTPDAEAVSRWDVGGSSTTSVVPLAPVPAVPADVAVDGSRVVVADNSDVNGAVTQRSVTANGSSLSVGASTEIADDVDLAGTNGCPSTPYDTCSLVAAGGGLTTFLRPDYPRVDQLVTYSGLTQLASVANPAGAVAVTDGTYVLLRRLTGDDLTYTPGTGALGDAGWLGSDLSGGSVVAPVSTIPQTGIRVTDIASATSTSLAEPAGCAEVRDAQAAGPWLLVGCTSSASLDAADSWGVVDRSGAHSSWVETPAGGVGRRWLGNGFVVRDNGTGALAWTSLADGTHTWYPLGTWTRATGQLALDKVGTSGTVAWVGTDALVHVAVIPVLDRTGSPGAPGTPSAVAGDGSATVSWTAPDSDGYSPVTGYDVTPSPACPTCTGLSTTGTSTTVSGLVDGTAYTFTVAARNVVGPGAASAPSASVTPRSAGTLRLVSPISALSSRSLASHATVTFALPSTAPSTATGADLEVSVTAGSSAAAVTAYGAGSTRPSSPDLRAAAGTTASGLVVTRVGSGRQVTLYNGATTAITVSAVVKGYLVPDLLGSTVHAGTPVSALASRSVAAHATVTFALPSSVPASASGVDLVLSAGGSTAAGTLTVFAAGSSRPSTPDLRYAKGTTSSALVLSRVGTSRSVSIYNSGSAAVTVTAAMPAYLTPDLSGATEHLAPPATVLPSTALAGGSAVTFTLPTSVGPGVTSADLVVATSAATASGYVTLYAAGTTRPGSVSARYAKSTTSTAAVLSAVGAGRKVTVYNAGTGSVTLTAVLVGSDTSS
ncbi:MAG TPA: fibronectin type III domain-containing protein [Actinomycetes bacterium]|nr:fibronectin type III domain-containing protein [Actinomycetes bacterium]